VSGLVPFNHVVSLNERLQEQIREDSRRVLVGIPLPEPENYATTYR